MPVKRPKPFDGQEVPSSPPGAAAPEGEDSIEIVEVVGMEDESPRPATEEIETAPTAEEADIPYSRRELYDLLLRKQAEFENAKKRLQREREEVSRRAWCAVLDRLLPFIDNLERALAASGDAALQDPFRRGVEMSFQQLRETLAREGLEAIGAVGEKFDPHLHEAVESRRVDGFEEGIVIEELRKGYRFQGQLLRPALVRVTAAGGRDPAKQGSGAGLQGGDEGV